MIAEICAAVLIILLCLIIHYRRTFRFFKRLGVRTLEPSFPFGNATKMIYGKQSINDLTREVYEEMKSQGCRYAGIYFLTEPVFLPIDVDLVKNILTKDFNYFDDRGIYYDEENDPVSAHLFSLHGEKWKRLRGSLTPAFSIAKIKYMFKTILDCGDSMIEHLIKTDQNADIEIRDVLARYTTDVIGSCAFGIECNSLKDPDAEFRVMGQRAFTQTTVDVLRNAAIRISPLLAKVFKLSVFPSSVSKFFKGVVEDTISFREKNDVTRNDFMQLLIKLKNGESLDGTVSCDDQLTVNEAAAQAFIFFLAGFETTSTSLGFAILEIALDDKIQNRIRQEIITTLKKYENDINYDFIAELQYLEMVLLESLRKYPPAPAYLRKCTKDYQIPESNVTIPKNTTVLLPTMAIHRDPEFYENPTVFDPERFSEENKHKLKDSVFIPFGDGPRKCLGMRFAITQSKLALALLIKNFKIKLSPRTTLPLKMATRGIVLAPACGIWITFEKIP